MYLGIDIGTSSVKVTLIEGNQKIIGSGHASLDVGRPHPGWSEQNPLDWITATKQAIGAIQATHARSLAAVTGIGLSGQMHGATLLDQHDEPLRACILWNDTRAHREASELDDNPMFRKISGNIVFPGFTAPKLVWVKNNEPDTFAALRWVLLPKDYLRLWLTGQHVSDMSDASGTGWLNTGARTWSEDLLAATALDERQMPALAEGVDATGTLRAEHAELWGMGSKVIVAGGASDNAASACGMGTVRHGSAFVSIGTSGVLFVANDTYLPNAASAVHTFCHALPASWHQMGVNLSATDSLNWLASLTCRSVAELTGELGEALKPPGNVTFLPYLSGERTPHNDAKIRGVFAGLSHESGHPQLTQAVLEGVAFALRDSLEALRAAGTEITRVMAIGGGSRSRYWLSAIATALNVVIEVPEEGDFGAAFGAARLGLIAAESADPLSVCTAPAASETIAPNRELTPAYATAYERYRALYETARGFA